MRALAPVLAAVALAAVGGCGGSSSGPRTLPAVSATPVASASASSAAVVDVPVEARAATSAGAEAFARFFYAQTVVAFSTKNPDLISALSAPGCTACGNYIRSLTKLRDNNERVEHFTLKVVLAVAPAVVGQVARVDVSWMTPDVAVRYDAKGKELFRDGPYTRVDDEMKLLRSGDRWSVASLRSLRRQK